MVPAPNADFQAMSARRWFTLGLKNDGSIVVWGNQAGAPPPNSNFVAIAAGADHSLGLKADGTLVAWGSNAFGQTNVPPPATGYGLESGVVPPRGAVAGGTTVTIYGANLCDSNDVVNVTLCGVSATVVTSSPSRVVVVSGAASAPMVGDVVVESAAYGPVARTNAFTYCTLHTMTATAGSHGQATPSSTNVATFADAAFTITPDAWYHIEEVRTNGLPAGSNLGSSPIQFVWSRAIDTGTLHATFAENLAPMGTPEWWLAAFGLTNGGFAAADV